MNQELIPRLVDGLKKSTTYNFKNALYHINLGDGSDKAYEAILLKNTLYFPFSKDLEAELEKEDIQDVNLDLFSIEARKLSQQQINVFGNEIYFNTKTIYTSADVVKLHRLKHKLKKNIRFYGPSAIQEDQLHEEAANLANESEDFHELSFNGYLNVSTKNLKQILKPNSVVEINKLQFNHLFHSYLVN
jgi:hypothetical protein